MANPSRYWGKLVALAGAATRFRVTGEERRESLRLAMMAALALRPHEAQTREWEAQIPADVDAPMRRVNDAFAHMMLARAPLTRAQITRDLQWARIPPNFMD